MVDIREVPTKQHPWTFNFENQWNSLFNPKKFNWVDFTLFQADVENDKLMGNYNWTFGMLGFKFHGGYCYDPENPNLKEIDKMVDDLVVEDK